MTSAIAQSQSLEAILRADDLIVQQLLPVLSAHRMSLDVFRALRHLATGSQGLAVGDVGRLIACSPPATTRVVDRLVSEGLAYRRVDPLDRRRILVMASEMGRHTWTELCVALDGNKLRA